ncbi:hypothetical protein [Paenibacillus sp. LjRoot153]|uniref:hypothetical protein n=1 Tax=Paenibacillus sp. LjRoot153 TaxID=3342270 RepID=UPI003F50C139
MPALEVVKKTLAKVRRTKVTVRSLCRNEKEELNNYKQEATGETTGSLINALGHDI